MENKKILETIFTSQKSFYNKAYTIQENNIIKLYSYNTLVLTITFNINTKKYQLNYNVPECYLFSQTTKKHITECLKQYSFNIENNKKEIIKNNNIIFNI